MRGRVAGRQTDRQKTITFKTQSHYRENKAGVLACSLGSDQDHLAQKGRGAQIQIHKGAGTMTRHSPNTLELPGSLKAETKDGKEAEGVCETIKIKQEVV